ncbi:ABC transporter ATP-binding protein [Photobacterium carnosum]|nr:ABC transporter ATP-binding protein [Photobacterium carnosum]
MSCDYAIKVNNLSKSYLIYEKPHHRFLQMVLRNKKNYYKEFWANSNISLEIKKGSTFGIIGENGSGKSTLLQMLCGTLNPTAGDISINGKVAALLELGAGFNPEFTGRENIYVAGSLYGLKKAEIDKKYNDIINFADIGEHLEQPVKNYSSGMYVRLAFAVIAHVDADILVIDEALSVGDAIFQQKCMRFIRKFQKKGTLLFVSHDMSSVLNLCEDAIWLEKGQVRQIGTAKEISEAYLKYSLQEVYGNDVSLDSLDKEVSDKSEKVEVSTTKELALDYKSINKFSDNTFNSDGWKTGGAEIKAIKISDSNNDTNPVFKGNDFVSIEIEAELMKDMEKPILGFILKDRLGQDIFGENTLGFKLIKNKKYLSGTKIKGKFEFIMPYLPNGQYVMMASVAEGTLSDNIQHHYLHDAAVINVSNSEVRWGLVGVKFLDVVIKEENS